jgi:hypothetical protein
MEATAPYRQMGHIRHRERAAGTEFLKISVISVPPLRPPRLKAKNIKGTQGPADCVLFFIPGGKNDRQNEQKRD